jgi:hypothetical protein
MLKTEYAINENITKTEITRLKLQQLYETMTRSPTTLWDYDTTAHNSMRLWHDRQQLYETMTRPPTTLWDYDTTTNISMRIWHDQQQLWDYDTIANNSMRLWHDLQQLYETMTWPPTTLWDYDTTPIVHQVLRRRCRT